VRLPRGLFYLYGIDIFYCKARVVRTTSRFAITAGAFDCGHLLCLLSASIPPDLKGHLLDSPGIANSGRLSALSLVVQNPPDMLWANDPESDKRGPLSGCVIMMILESPHPLTV